jgi:hypothetical protein
MHRKTFLSEEEFPSPPSPGGQHSLAKKATPPARITSFFHILHKSPSFFQVFLCIFLNLL